MRRLVSLEMRLNPVIMKTHILPTVIAGLGLAVFPLYAENQATTDPSQPLAAQSDAAETTSTYVVYLRGAG